MHSFFVYISFVSLFVCLLFFHVCVCVCVCVFLLILIYLQIKTHGFEFKKHVSDDLHPSSASNANKTGSRCDINTMNIEY